MKIIDKRTDYFDHACQYSPEPLWIRKETPLKVDPFKRNDVFTKTQLDHLRKAYDAYPAGVSHWDKTRSSHKSFILGYCGRLILVYAVMHYDFEKADPIYKLKSYTNVTKFIQQWNKTWYRNGKNNNNFSELKEHTSWTRTDFTPEGIKSWHVEFDNPKVVKDMFVRIKSPIFIMEGQDEIIVNPSLTKYGIQSIINPFTAHQEIERYLGNDLVMCNQLCPDFGDELKRDAHGMDKWSFKNRTCPKKRKRKKK